MIVYKVVRAVFERGDVWESATAIAYRIPYRLGTSTSRPDGCGPLAAFASPEAACDFIAENLDVWDGPALLRCEGVQSKDIDLWRPDWHSGDRVTRRNQDLPWGALLMDSITPIELLDYRAVTNQPEEEEAGKLL